MKIGTFNLKFKLLLAFVAVLIVVTVFNIGLSAYWTNSQNEEEASQRLSQQLTLLQKDLEKTQTDFLNAAHSVARDSTNLRDLALLYIQEQQQDFEIAPRRVISLDRLQLIMGTSGFTSAAIYTQNHLSHYLTQDRIGMIVKKDGQQQLLGTEQKQGSKFNTSDWRLWKEEPLPPLVEPEIAISETMHDTLEILEQGTLFKVFIPIYSSSEVVDSVIVEELGLEELTKDIKWEDAPPNKGKMIGAYVFSKLLDKSFLEESAERTGMSPALFSPDGSQNHRLLPFEGADSSWLEKSDNSKAGAILQRVVSLNGVSYYQALMPWLLDNTPRLILSVALSREGTLAKIQEKVLATIVMGILILVLVSVIGGILVNRLAAPITSLTRTVSSINVDHAGMAIQLAVRSNDEIGQLTRAFNGMLGRLQQSFQQIHRQSDEIIIQNEAITKKNRELSYTGVALAQANSRLKSLLEATKIIVSTGDRYTVMTQACDIILKEIPARGTAKVHIYFWEQQLSGGAGYSYFAFPVTAKSPHVLSIQNIKTMIHSFSLDPPENVDEQDHRCLVKDDTLHIPIWYSNRLYALIEVEHMASKKLSDEDLEFLATLSYSLAVQLKDLGLTAELQKDLVERARRLKESNSRLEQQNTTLSATNRKLEDLNNTKEQLLSKLRVVHDDHLEALEKHLEQLLKAASPGTRDLVRQAWGEAHEIEEIIRPITNMYVSEQTIQSKRVMLAESDRKQQIIGKMALGGTGVELDIVSDAEEGKSLLEQNHYDILCVDSQLLELAKIAHEKSPSTQSVFMTSDDAPAYLQKLMRNPFLSNIVSRNEEDRTFTLKNILTTISKLTSEDLFGLEKYLNWGVDVNEHPIVSSENRLDVVDDMLDHLRELGVRRGILNSCATAAEELLMNAIYDAPLDANGKERYNHLPRTVPVNLEPQEQGNFRYACDGMLLAISAVDPFGALDRRTILEYLESCYEGRAGSMQQDQGKGGAGRGLFQIMENCDLLVMNVKSGVKTEVIAIFNIDPNQATSQKTTSFHYFYA